MMAAAFLGILPSNQGTLIPEGQPPICEIEVREVPHDMETEEQKSAPNEIVYSAKP